MTDAAGPDPATFREHELARCSGEGCLSRVQVRVLDIDKPRPRPEAPREVLYLYLHWRHPNGPMVNGTSEWAPRWLRCSLIDEVEIQHHELVDDSRAWYCCAACLQPALATLTARQLQLAGESLGQERRRCLQLRVSVEAVHYFEHLFEAAERAAAEAVVERARRRPTRGHRR